MPRAKAAVSEAVVESPPEVTESVQETPSEPVVETPSEAPEGTGAEKTPGQEEPSKTETPVQESREEQAAADRQREVKKAWEEKEAVERRANELERQVNELARAQAERDREARRERLRQLKESDPDAYIEEREREDEQSEAATRSWGEYENRVLSVARQNASTYFPDITSQDFDAAHAEIDRLARSSAGRPANMVEVLAMVGEHRVRKERTVREKLETENKELRAHVSALEGSKTAAIVDGDEGPDAPSPSVPGNGRLTLDRWKSMSAHERNSVSIEEETRMIREEMKRRTR